MPHCSLAFVGRWVAPASSLSQGWGSFQRRVLCLQTGKEGRRPASCQGRGVLGTITQTSSGDLAVSRCPHTGSTWWGAMCRKHQAPPVEPHPTEEWSRVLVSSVLKKLDTVSFSTIKIPTWEENACSHWIVNVSFACFPWQALFGIAQGDPARTTV